MTQIALIVHTCDRYKLLYPGFEYFFKKYFPSGDIPVSYYFLTEDEDFHSDIFTNIKTGKGEWSERLLRGLEAIPEPYVMYFQEDMWLCKPVDADTVNKIISFTIEHEADLFKLSSNSVYKTVTAGRYINGLAVTLLDNNRSQYLMSHQVSIWEKSFFSGQLRFKEHPWRNERKGTERLKVLNPDIYHIDLFVENEQQPINNNKEGAIISRYYTVSQNAQLNAFALPFIEEMKADDATKEYAEKLEHNMKNQLTHDGLTQPRKDDIFKKIKRWFKK
ncbi:hypothetical protein KXQ82_01645 [Mucilaginibacter sp. HMF5004]|uniref:hypothetical protein n=1 Tax=Mucilaginibacter rivuli TaxID=2857527 RepID=UPI001C5D8748|nr:hypothetical protein [Mucilaginibacter rivuli]MBW4888394.1 hypothetical protein [Mucilaginibacter rivuli]